MSVRRFVLAGLLLAGLPQVVSPQGASPPRRLTLEQALGLAVPASEAIDLARSGVDRAEGEERRARSSLLPQLNGSASFTRLLKSQFSGLGVEDTGGDPAPTSCDAFAPLPAQPIGERVAALEQSVRCVSRLNPFGSLGSLPFGRANTWNLGLEASQTLFAGGRLANGVRAAGAGVRSARLGVDAARAELTLRVVEAYYDAALADRLVAIAQAALDQADTTLTQTALRREVGTAPEFDLLRATVARDNLRPPRIQAEAQRDIAYHSLRHLLNLPGAEPLELVTALTDTAFTGVPTLAALVARAPDTSADQRVTVRQAAEAVAAQDALLRAARGELLPAISVLSQYGKVAYPSGGLPDWNDFYTNWNVVVGLQVPLFTGGRLRAGREVARAGLAEAELRRRQAAEGASLDAHAARARLDAAAATWTVSAGTIAQANRAYEIAEVRFREGISTQTELLDARLALQQAEANRAQAARDYLVARVRFALIADLPLDGGSAAPARSQSSPRPAQPAASTSTGPGFP